MCLEILDFDFDPPLRLPTSLIPLRPFEHSVANMGGVTVRDVDVSVLRFSPAEPGRLVAVCDFCGYREGIRFWGFASADTLLQCFGQYEQ